VCGREGEAERQRGRESEGDRIESLPDLEEIAISEPRPCIHVLGPDFDGAPSPPMTDWLGPSEAFSR